MTTLGIDAAGVDDNGRIDWDAARNAGVRFAILRMAYGTDIDEWGLSELPRALAAGMTVGGYFFPPTRSERHPKVSDPDQMLRAWRPVIDRVLKLKREPGRMLVPSMDVEYADDTTAPRAERITRVRAVWSGLRAMCGAPPMIYTSHTVYADELGSPNLIDLVDSPVWLKGQRPRPRHYGQPYTYRKGPARYQPEYRDRVQMPQVPASWAKAWGEDFCPLQQFQGDGRGLPGIKQCDLNLFRPDGLGRWVDSRLRDRPPREKASDAIRRFQSSVGLKVDGIVGLLTFAELSLVG